MSFDLQKYLTDCKEQIDTALDEYLPSGQNEPTELHSAIRHSLFAGGKRLRGALVFASAETCGGNREEVLPVACALECIHSYSLIHDDLPCMDNADFRRGKPSCHKAFGEAMAVLAGDALLTHAFFLVSKITRKNTISKILDILGWSAGLGGMVKGQAFDILHGGYPKNQDITESVLEKIHRAKTGALISASLKSGALAAGGNENQVDRLGRYGDLIGLAFQVADDILDVESTSEALGKAAGKDAESGKVTYPSLLGLEASRKKAERLVQEARAMLEPLGDKATVLHSIAQFIIQRAN